MFTSGKMPSVRLQQFFNREEDKLVKSHTHLKKRLEKICWKKMKKPHKLSGNWDKKDNMAKRFQELLLNHSLSKIGSTTLVNPRKKGKFGSSNHGRLILVDRT